jgi:hypothetical protein
VHAVESGMIHDAWVYADGDGAGPMQCTVLPCEGEVEAVANDNVCGHVAKEFLPVLTSVEYRDVADTVSNCIRRESGDCRLVRRPDAGECEHIVPVPFRVLPRPHHSLKGALGEDDVVVEFKKPLCIRIGGENVPKAEKIVWTRGRPNPPELFHDEEDALARAASRAGAGCVRCCTCGVPEVGLARDRRRSAFSSGGT